MKVEHDVVFKEKIPIIEKILGDLRKHTPEEGLSRDRQVQRGTRVGGAAAEQQEARALSQYKQTIKINSLEAPSFNGPARSYARFKHHFREMIVSNYGRMG